MKYCFVFLFLFVCATVYAENNNDTFFLAQIGKNKIEITGNKGADNKFDDNKILILKDKEGKILDSINIYYPDTNYRESVLLSNDAFALRITIKEPYKNCFIYANSQNKKFSFHDCSKWVADGIILDNYIIYSTEFDDNTIKKLDLSNDSIYSYDGYYPNVTIYEYLDNEILGVFEFEGEWYEICKDIIRKSTKQYQVSKNNIYEHFLR